MHHDNKWKSGKPRNNWINTIYQDLKTVDMLWDKAEQAATKREELADLSPSELETYDRDVWITETV